MLLQWAVPITQNETALCSQLTLHVTAGDPFGLLLRQRIVFLGGEVEDFGADAIISQLLLLDNQDASKDIKMFINSPGTVVVMSGKTSDCSQVNQQAQMGTQQRHICVYIGKCTCQCKQHCTAVLQVVL